MAERKNSYKQLEFYLTIAVIVNAALFFIYMICAGTGVTWAKIFLAILCLVLSVGTLAVLYIKKELLRPRSLWMTLAAWHRQFYPCLGQLPHRLCSPSHPVK